MPKKSNLPVEVLLPGGQIEAYIQAVSQIPILTAEEEKEIADRLYYDNDLDAARYLVMSHLRFVVHIARSYSGYGLPQADLIQEGNVGLMKAVKRFNPEMGVRLVSFAVHWIKAEMHEYISEKLADRQSRYDQSPAQDVLQLEKCQEKTGLVYCRRSEKCCKRLGCQRRRCSSDGGQACCARHGV